MNLSLNDNKLIIDLEWYEQLWAFTLTQRLEIPLDHIDRATTEEPQSDWAEIRSPGTFVPGLIKAGTYYSKRGREFWYVTRDRDYLTLDLNHESYRRIVLTLPQSETWAATISQTKTV